MFRSIFSLLIHTLYKTILDLYLHSVFDSHRLWIYNFRVSLWNLFAFPMAPLSQRRGKRCDNKSRSYLLCARDSWSFTFVHRCEEQKKLLTGIAIHHRRLFQRSTHVNEYLKIRIFNLSLCSSTNFIRKTEIIYCWHVGIEAIVLKMIGIFRTTNDGDGRRKAVFDRMWVRKRSRLNIDFRLAYASVFFLEIRKEDQKAETAMLCAEMFSM